MDSCKHNNDRENFYWAVRCIIEYNALRNIIRELPDGAMCVLEIFNDTGAPAPKSTYWSAWENTPVPPVDEQDWRSLPLVEYDDIAQALEDIVSRDDLFFESTSLGVLSF